MVIARGLAPESAETLEKLGTQDSGGDSRLQPMIARRDKAPARNRKRLGDVEDAGASAISARKPSSNGSLCLNFRYHTGFFILSPLRTPTEIELSECNTIPFTTVVVVVVLLEIVGLEQQL